LEHVAQEIAQDVISYVRQHPAYGQMVTALGDAALRALAAEAGISI